MSLQASTTKKRQRPTTAIIEEAKRSAGGNQSINKTALAFGISGAYLPKIIKKSKNTGLRKNIKSDTRKMASAIITDSLKEIKSRKKKIRIKLKKLLSRR
ncbi:hypothetical protein JTB14_032949 [Gonioctena quinquepunctata]|nr:hypothetical protein JTB14_032949 [Gonioctena quinquepunctata]